MRKALIVGINYYDSIDKLYGCVEDARSVKNMLEHHEEGNKNFGCKLLIGTNNEERVDRSDLKDSISELFEGDAEIALLYFSGHGYIESVGGYLITIDSNRGDEGLALSEILSFANKSPAKNKIIILDSCHSGIAGDNPVTENLTALSEGTTFLTASTKDQYAIEENGRGLFTTLLVDAFDGSAANLIGDITPGSIYAHIDQSLGEWDQRPVFKTNVKNFVSLRKVQPPISVENLRKISDFFPTSGFELQLDPTYEPEMEGRDKNMPKPDIKNTETFDVLQQYNRLNLLKPVGARHMWHAAMQSKKCKLTAIGEHYRRLVLKGRI